MSSLSKFKPLLYILITTIIIYIFWGLRESFTGTQVSNETKSDIKNAHNNIPAVDQKLVTTVKDSIKNIINNRPDLIETAREVISDPLIRSTLDGLLFGNTTT